MNKLSFKKFLPGLVSVIIIAGMAVQSFATNIDLAAFVNKDKYMTKYYELDWRIKDIDGRLDRLYKFTCKNVKSFVGGSASNYAINTPFAVNFWAGNYDGDNWLYAYLDDPKAIRVNTLYAFGIYGTPSLYRRHTKIFKKEFPASICKWKPGIELLPNTKVKIEISDDKYATNDSTLVQTVIMGPFKKFPKYTSTGGSPSTGYICETPFCLFQSTWNWTNVMSYAYGSETEPTSWTSIGSDVNTYTYGYYNAGWNESQYPPLTREDYENGDVALGKKSMAHTKWYFQAGTVADLSSRTNVWLRIRYSYNSTGGYSAWLNMGEFNITNWNANK